MNSEELNAGIRTLCGRDDLSDGEKAIPYVGWFWREVDFDAPAYQCGVIPGEWQGFMENNKWDYGYSRPTTPDEWAHVKGLLAAAILTPSREACRAVWDAIQAVTDAGIPASCEQRQSRSGFPMRCIREAAHEGECSFALDTQALAGAPQERKPQ